jgi:hypothetical protein
MIRRDGWEDASMRLIPLMSAAFVFAFVVPAIAQDEWIEFSNQEDGFSVNFPVQPRVEQSTWVTQCLHHDARQPALRV